MDLIMRSLKTGSLQLVSVRKGAGLGFIVYIQWNIGIKCHGPNLIWNTGVVSLWGIKYLCIYILFDFKVIINEKCKLHLSVKMWYFKWYLLLLPIPKGLYRKIMVIFLLKIWRNLKEYGLGLRRSKCENGRGWISFMTSWGIQAILTLKQKRRQFKSFSQYIKNVMSEHCFNNAFHTWLSPRLSFFILQPQVYSVFVYKYCSVIVKVQARSWLDAHTEVSRYFMWP